MSAALAVVLLLLASFSVWGAERTRSAAGLASRASLLADSYAEAASAVAAMESLERKYRLEPSPENRERYDASADALRRALAHIHDRGNSTDRLLAVSVSRSAEKYLVAAHRLFAAIEAGRTAEVILIDRDQADPAFTVVEDVVVFSADQHRARAVATLDQLAQTERRVFWATLGAFGAGLIVLGLLLRMMGVHLRRMQWQAEHDLVTGLPNRAQLQSEIERVLSAADDGHRVAVMLLDLNRFKEVNDTLGHDVGNDLLRLVGPRLAAALRDGDVVAHIGGDEFGIVHVQDDGSDASTRQFAERLTAAFRKPFILDEVALQVGASIGIAFSPGHGVTADLLLQRAEIAMYVAKEAGAEFRTYEPADDGNTRRRLRLLAGLRQAIEEDQLVLDYQPEIRLGDGLVVGVEALVRWQHPTDGLIGPGDFIPQAESSGLIHDLTLHVLALALAQAHAWMLDDMFVPVAVNLSARCLLNRALPDLVKDLLHSEGVPASLLKLEVTETAMMVDRERAVGVLQRLSDLGVQLSIDDFGTGYTSMTYLSDLPVDELKIDLSFVQRMLTEPRADAVVRASIDLAARMGMTVVAEGIEDAATFEALVAHGCDQGQGYLISRPRPAAELDAFLRTRARVAAAQN